MIHLAKQQVQKGSLLFKCNIILKRNKKLNEEQLAKIVDYSRSNEIKFKFKYTVTTCLRTMI